MYSYRSYTLLASLVGISMLSAQTGPPSLVNVKDNEELKEIFREDQRDRGEDPFDKEATKSLKAIPWKDVMARDTQRLSRVRTLLQAGQIQTAQDKVYAAFVLQHGQSGDDFALAHVLATTAALNAQPAPRWARWLAAAALDRFLHHSNQPQIFGTQAKGQKSIEGTVMWTLEPYNRTAVTDALRKEWCVISLKEQDQMISRASQGQPLGPSNIRDCR